MGTKTQQRKEREASRAYSISLVNTVVLVVTFVFGAFWQIYQRHSYEKQFGSIQTSLRLLTATVAPQLQKAIDDSLISALREAPSQASQELANVENDTSSLRKLKAKLPVQDVSQTAALLQKAVNKNPDIVPAWRAVAQMVSYRSELVSEPKRLPDCFKTQGSGGLFFTSAVVRYHDCALNLNDVDSFKAVLPRLVQGNVSGTPIPTVFLENGIVLYSGGNMISIEKLICKNCSFDLESPRSLPPPPGRALSQQLLAADLTDVSVSLPKGNG